MSLDAEETTGRLAAIVESADDAIVSKTLEGIVTSWNAGAERLFGYGAAEMIGQPITRIIPSERLGEEDYVLSRVRAGLRVHHFETERVRKDGSRVEISLTVSPIRTADGRVVGASKIARDITQRKALERAIAQASRAKDEFLATLSHELRTPLNTVLGYTEMLKSGTIPWEDRSKALEAISRNAEALQQLVNDVLDTSRIVTGKIRLNVQVCDVGTIAHEAVETVRPAAQAKGVGVNTDITSGLVVQGDPDRLRQVLWNLLSNAVKFTPSGGAVNLSVVPDTRAIRVVVEDTGVGIDSEALPYVFERFWQADRSHTRSHGGLGLGLALVRHFIELHGGQVRAHSDGSGHGARFEISLPTAGVSA